MMGINSKDVFFQHSQEDDQENHFFNDIDSKVDIDPAAKRETLHTRMNFPVYEYNKLQIDGNATIEIKINDTKKARTGKAILSPVTTYSTEWYVENILKGKKLSPVDTRLYNYIKFAPIKNGKAIFFGIGEGRYFLSIKLHNDTNEKQNIIVKKITIRNEEHRDIEIYMDTPE